MLVMPESKCRSGIEKEVKLGEICFLLKKKINSFDLKFFPMGNGVPGTFYLGREYDAGTFSYSYKYFEIQRRNAVMRQF